MYEEEPCSISSHFSRWLTLTWPQAPTDFGTETPRPHNLDPSVMYTAGTAGHLVLYHPPPRQGRHLWSWQPPAHLWASFHITSLSNTQTCGSPSIAQVRFAPAPCSPSRPCSLPNLDTGSLLSGEFFHTVLNLCLHKLLCLASTNLTTRSLTQIPSEPRGR